MLKKIINALLIMSVIVASANALTAKERKKQERMAGIESEKYPFDPTLKNIPPFVKEDRFKMSLKEKEFEEVKDKLDNFKMIMNSTIGMEILQKPVFKNIKTIDTLYFHPSYQTTIILPEGSKISYAKPSFKITQKITFSENVLNVQPDKSFLNGNIIIYYSRNKKNYHLNIIAKNYTTAKCSVDAKREIFLCADSSFGIVYQYQDNMLADDTDVFFAYVDLVGGNLDKIKKRGFSSVQYGGKIYYIILDNKFGTLFYHGDKYRISTKI